MENKQLISKNIFTSYPSYAFEILADIFLGTILGFTVNTITDIISEKLHLSKYMKLILQLFFITVVLYVMKVDSRYLYASWKGETNYGIIFTAIFIGSQRNVIKFMENIYKKEISV